MTDVTPKKLKVQDANLSDDRIPRNLILMYGDEPYIRKAGLEWKANKLFGGAGYSLHTEFIERQNKERYYLVKATLTVLENGAVFENYGETSPENTNSNMQKNLLHLAITRAECRVLRMATACGYASYDEVMTLPNGIKPEVPQIENGDKPATEAQLKTLKVLVPEFELERSGITRQEAAEKIAELSSKEKVKK